MQPKIELTQAVELADFGLDEFLSQLSADSICIFLGDLLDLRRTSGIIIIIIQLSSLILWIRFMKLDILFVFLFTCHFVVVTFTSIDSSALACHCSYLAALALRRGT